jgi:uncharacterized protein YyaL (SSP411 family)
LVDAAQAAVELAVPIMQRAPTGAGQMLIAADMALGPMREVIVTGDQDELDMRDVVRRYWQHYTPNCVFAGRGKAQSDDDGPLQALFAGKAVRSDSPTVYVCRQFACGEPISGKTAALEQWHRMAAARGVD